MTIMETDKAEKQALKAEEIEKCISVLEYLLENGDQLVHLGEEQRIKLMKAAGQITRPDRAERKKRNKGADKVKKQEI